jgi:hypothetical protein
MKTTQILLLSASLLSAASALAQPAHLTKAQQLLDEVQAAQEAGVYTDGTGTSLNRYGGSWGSATDASFIRFADLANGVLPANYTRCAPLITHLLKYTSGWNWKNYTFIDPLTNSAKSTASPAPYQYIALVKQGKGFAARVTRLDQAQPGDLLFWWQVGSDQSDHAMIVSSIDWSSAKAYPANLAGSDPTLAGSTYYEVEVIDSSANLHTNDSRLVNVNGTDTQIAGIGTGTIGVLVNANFEIVATTWSLPASDYTTQPNSWLSGLTSRLKRTPAWEIVIGRMP